MAKRGRKKKSKTGPSFKFSVELTGLILILIGIIGLGVLGPVGNVVKEFSVFFFGAYYNVFTSLILLLGIAMLFKRRLPNFFNHRLIGVYFLIISGLTLAHIKYIDMSVGFTANIDLYRETFLEVINDSFIGISETGGGIIGDVFCYCFISLIDNTGAIIVCSVLAFVGLIFLFNISFVEIIENIKAYFVSLKNRPKKEKPIKEEKVKMYNQDDEIDINEDDKDKVIVKSIEELKHRDDEVKYSKPVTSVPEINIPLTNTNYHLPSLEQVLNPLKKNKKANTDDFIRSTSYALQNVLLDFGITGKVVAVHEGPTVTQFEVAIKNGTKVSKITGLSKEIALSLAAKDVRIEAPIPGKTTVGIEIPNREAVGVAIREVLEKKEKEMFGMKLPVSLGKDINGNDCIADLSKTPHLLVAGSTGSGKSVCINSFINSLLITKRPDEVKLVLVDPKKVELSNYNGVPHLLCPVVTDPKKASVALQNIVKIMEERYDIFADEKVKNIGGYNEKIAGLIKKNPSDPSLKLMPYIVVIIDELADLMLVASKEVEDSIMRITQMARAAGIHLIVATQRPSTDVITGVVKANIPSRLAFAVASQIDSRTILDMGGAEKLLGKGDMLYKPMGENTPLRIQGNFISDEEIEKVIAYVSHEQIAQYDETITQVKNDGNGSSDSSSGGDYSDSDDPLYNEVVEFALETGKVSASLIQRRFRVGYNRAARIVDELEMNGIIGPQNGSKPREVLVKVEPNVPNE